MKDEAGELGVPACSFFLSKSKEKITILSSEEDVLMLGASALHVLRGGCREHPAVCCCTDWFQVAGLISRNHSLYVCFPST